MPFLSVQPQINNSQRQSLWDKAQSVAEWVSSRESTYRSALDLVGWELPSMVAAATRNIYSFAESCFLAVMGFTMIWAAPNITKYMGKFLAQFHLKPEETKDVNKLLYFQLNDLDNAETVKSSIERMKHEEPEDCGFMADLHQNKAKKVEYYKNRAKDFLQFFDNVEIDDEKRERIKSLKKSVILGESFVESFVWGGFYFFNRMFRKYVLGQDRFTGTKAYENDKDAAKTGDTAELKLWNKLGIFGSMLSAPVVNKFLLNKIEDKEAMKKSSWLKTIKSQWDMTHGVFPKLGLLFSFVQIPVTIGQMFAAQGKNELMENILRQFTMVPSWWFGHNLTNGVLAKRADAKLAEKHGVQKGILLESSEINKLAPEPAKIQHILKQVRGNEALEKDARKEHAKSLYLGFSFHALLVFAARLLMNQFTKWRVTKQLKHKAPQ